MVDLPVKRQAQLLSISRGAVYYHPEPIPEAELALMRRIDELHLEYPFAGSRMLRDLLRLQGIEVGRRYVATLMRRVGIQALYRKPNTSKKHPAARRIRYSRTRCAGWPSSGPTTSGRWTSVRHEGAICNDNETRRMNVSESKLADCRPAARDAASHRWRPGERGPQSLAVCRRPGVMRRAA